MSASSAIHHRQGNFGGLSVISRIYWDGSASIALSVTSLIQARKDDLGLPVHQNSALTTETSGLQRSRDSADEGGQTHYISVASQRYLQRSLNALVGGADITKYKQAYEGERTK